MKGDLMPEEKKSRYTESQKRAAEKYLSEKVEDIKIRVPKGKKEVIRSHATGQGESMNQFIVRAIDETMERDAE
jgi:predicted HicB family RNase H-like nuclease